MRPVVLSFSRYLDPFQFFPLSPLSYTNDHFCYVWMWRCSPCLSELFCLLFPWVLQLLSVMIGCLATMFAQTFRSLCTELWITFNKGSSLHEIWAAWLWPWGEQSKQCFSTTDSTPLCSALTTLSTDAVFYSKWNPWPIFHETQWSFVILTTQSVFTDTDDERIINKALL